MLRKLSSRKVAPPPPPSNTTILLQHAERVTGVQVAPLRLFWGNLNSLRSWWPILLPLLVWAGWRTYQEERAAVRNRTS